jgi:hypothetical protein
MDDFHLTFVRSGQDYLLCAGCKLAGEAEPVPFEAARLVQFGAAAGRLAHDFECYGLSATDEASLVNGLLTMAGGHPVDSKAGGSATHGEMKTWSAVQIGQALYREIFQGDILNLFLKSLALARERRTALRILVKAWYVPEMHDIPWELLHDGTRFLAHSPETPVVRYLEQEGPVRSLTVVPPLRVLFTTACPAGVPPLDLKTEETNVRTALALLGDRARLEVENDISYERLRYRLLRAQSQRLPFHVWHHSGHGQLSHGQGVDFKLILTNSAGDPQPTGVAELQPILHDCPDLLIAVLNACHSGSTAGLATAMARLNVPGVVGFRTRIFDHSALIFAETFYRYLIEHSLETAVSRSRCELLGSGYDPLDWAQPLLFARTEGGGPILSAPCSSSSPGASMSTVIRFGGSTQARNARNYGRIVIGDGAKESTGDLRIEFDPQQLNADDLTQVGELRLSHNELSSYSIGLAALLKALSGNRHEEGDSG